jgi:hypothetical protein
VAYQSRNAAHLSPDARFRPQILDAIAAGVALEAMTLRLTLQDANRLARDRNTPVADIRYNDGVMYFLGVKVEAGGVAKSVLDQT